MDLVTLDFVKVRLTADGTTMGSKADSFLNQLIAMYSRSVERIINGSIGLQKVERTEQYDHFYAAERFRLRSWPVDTSEIFKVWVDGGRAFSDADLLEADPDGDYYVDARLGFVEFDAFYVQTEFGPGVIKVQYTAGFGVDADSLVLDADFSDLVSAVADQVIYHYRRRAAIGGNISAGTGNANYAGALKLLDHVRDTALSFRRTQVG